MPLYRIYLLDSEDHVSGPPRIVECADDHDAVGHAQRYLASSPIEVWLDAGRLEPQQAGPPGWPLN
jgi:hypothetical protein